MTLRCLLNPWRFITPEQQDTLAEAYSLLKVQIVMYRQARENNLYPDAYIEDPELITHWVVGYVTGLLDGITQYRHNRAQYTEDMLALLYEVVFTERNLMTALGHYASAVAVKDSPQDPFYPVFKEFDKGLRDGFAMFFDALDGKPSMRLWKALVDGGIPSTSS